MFGKLMMRKTPSTLDDYIAAQGRNGDSVVAHLNPREVQLLKSRGGSGTINPKTGMLEFWDSDGEDGRDGSSSPGGGADSDPTGGSSEDATAFGGGYKGSWGADQDGFADTAFGRSTAGVPNSAQAEAQDRDDAIAAGFMANPGSYLSAKATNFGINMEQNYDEFTTDPLGYTINALTPSRQTATNMLGYALFGTPGLLVSKGLNYLGDKYGFRAPTAEEQAMVEGILGGKPGMSSAGAYASAPENSVAESLASLDTDRKRVMTSEPYEYNRQRVGLSNRDVPYIRR